jgi:hypothetical protein
MAAPDGADATHLQLTTGDVPSFHRTAELLFGSLFPTVEAVSLEPPEPVAAGTGGGS